MTSDASNLINGRRLARNTLWNLLGTGAPLLAAIIAIPILIEGMGTPRFGVLTLAWMVVGYFSLFDLGLGRALTKLVAERLGKEDGGDIPALVWTATILMALLGLLGGLIIVGFTPLLISKALKIPVSLQQESMQAFFMLAASVPIVTVSAGFRGILEAHQRFRMVNIIRIPLGILTFLGPLAVLPYSSSLSPMVVVLVTGRILMLVAYFLSSIRLIPGLFNDIRVRGYLLRQLLGFGGWMTVTNIIGPLMVYFDRFFIGSILTMSAVAYYATPHEVIMRLGVIPGAIVGVLFPAFSTALVCDHKHALLLFDRAVNYIFIAIFPFILVIITFAYEGLRIWLGSEFANNGAFVLQCLALGMLVNSLARIPSALIQGAGRPDITAKLHLLELPVYIFGLIWFIKSFGIKGAAIAWMLRVIVDTCALFVFGGWILPTTTLVARRILFMVVSGILSIGVVLIMPGIYSKSITMGVIMIAFIVTAWKYLLSHDERKFVGENINRYLMHLVIK